jgi:hypothetical protein
MRSILIILFFILTIVSVKSYGQRWMPGHYNDVKGNTEGGFIRFGSGKAPVKGEAFIEFKENKKAAPFKLSASDLRSFVIGRDSFVVGHAPGTENWAHNDFDFVRVVLDEDVKLYAAGGVVSGGGGSGFYIEPGIGVGVGSRGGGVGAGVDAGVAIPIGGSGGNYEYLVYYYGENTAHMKRLNDQNFVDIMSDIMGDYPDIVDKIHAKVYGLRNIDRLIALFNQEKAAGKISR